MKRLMIALAMAAMTAAPALAAGSAQISQDGRSARAAAQTEPGYTVQSSNSYDMEPGYGAYAAAPDASDAPISLGPAPVFAYGQYQGSDPDPFIRQQLMRDPPTTTSQE